MQATEPARAERRKVALERVEGSRKHARPIDYAIGRHLQKRRKPAVRFMHVLVMRGQT